MLALLELQTFAKAHGYKVIVANAFNQRQEGIIQYLRNNAGYLVDKFDWTTYIHGATRYSAFVQKLVELDGLLPADQWQGFHSYYHQRDWPAKYLTNCEGAHPTLEGYKVIGEELANFIKLRGYV
jgi:lysophospholipase L1-like esterase